MTSGGDDRQGFSSRTPENSNPQKVTYRRGFVTRHQVTGWRFVMRRIASGVAMHDTRMLVDPLRSQSRAVLMGVLILVTAVLGCFVFSFIRPGGAAGDDPVLADRDTAALYVRVDDQLHPVLNLTSARLIAGRAVNPEQVKSSELDRFPRGSMIGIPGAPERMVQAADRGANWTVCQGSDAIAPGVTVLAGAPSGAGEQAAALAADQAVLVDTGSGMWLLWNGQRSPIDLNDRAATGALGLGTSLPAPRPISTGLFNAIPEGVALRAPQIPGAGEWAQFPLPVGAPVGSVVVAYGADNTLLYYAVLSDGLQQISPVLAALLRNANSHGLQQPPRLGADEIAALPVSQVLDADAYPDQQLRLVDAASSPVTCVNWAKPVDASTSSLTLLAGAALPVADGVSTVDLAAGPASRVAIPAGTGYLVQTVGAEAAAPAAGALFWVSDTGVRYGIEAAGNADELAKTVSALGLTEPATPIPWPVLSLFSPGPALSKDGALAVYQTPSQNPGNGEIR
ncbi:type VII secretion protein EccB [Mycobacterium sp. MS1601]|uniref:type VII secretion protein EccB n=1 Tax=Mycobacterium sp. MS1601 TaxID=1936029 RepID=UPI0009794CA7|nr:type VII secretion protein EccB [Mycobacterium sp. MS1601]AQA03626.1 type VII secretion protein EccB [Mycobacterium sp. MS1601]